MFEEGGREGGKKRGVGGRMDRWRIEEEGVREGWKEGGREGGREGRGRER